MAGGPPVVVCARSDIEVTKENKLFITGDVADDGCEVLIEVVFVPEVSDIVGAYADKGDKTCSGLESHIWESLRNIAAWSYLAPQTVPYS